MHRCDTCEETFEDEWLLDIHKEIVHNNNVENVEEKEELEELDRRLAQHQKEHIKHQQDQVLFNM